MKKVICSVLALFAMAFSMNVMAATGDFKPSGFGQFEVAAQASALPDNSGAPAAVAVAADAVYVNILANPTIQAHRSTDERAAFVADVRPMAALKQNGIQADRGAKVRSVSTKLSI